MRTFLYHLLLFIGVEVLFVWIVFHEFPGINFYTLLGIGHMVYWLSLPLFAWLRVRAKTYLMKVVADVVPFVLHSLIHLIPIWFLLDEHHHCEHTCSHHHEPHSSWDMVGMTIVILVIICVGEYILHRRQRCSCPH